MCMMILIHKFSIVSIFLKLVQSYLISSRCGFPGLPYDTQIEPKKTIYEEGEEVRYSCPGDKIYAKTQVKRCVRGEWTGPRSTCGNLFRNQVVHIKVVDLENNQTIIDRDSSNITTEEWPVSYFDKKGTQIVLQEPNRPHQWFLQFENYVLFDFFLLNMRIPRSSAPVAVNEIDAIRVRDVFILNEDHRNCTIDFTNRQNKFAKVFWFWCTPSKEVMVNKNLSISFITETSQPMGSVGLHQVYLSKLQYCGLPPVPLFAKYLSHIQDGPQVVCDQEVSIELKGLSNSSNIREDGHTSEQEFSDCVDNQYWAGNPKCVPKIQCEHNYDEISESVVSVRNALILKEEEWIAFDGTTVHFKCNPGFELIGDSARTCLLCPLCVNASWDQSGPVCKAVHREPTSSSLSSGGVVAIVLTVTLVAIVAILIAGLIVLKLRKVNSHDINSSEQNPKESDFYDDINQMGNGMEVYSDYNYNNQNYSYDNYSKPEEYDVSGYEKPRYEAEAPKATVLLKDDYYLSIDGHKGNNNQEYDDVAIGKETSL